MADKLKQELDAFLAGKGDAPAVAGMVKGELAIMQQPVLQIQAVGEVVPRY